MHVVDDPRLISVAAECRRLEKAVSDAAWDSDPRLAQLTEELHRMKALHAQGVLYEPTF